MDFDKELWSWLKHKQHLWSGHPEKLLVLLFDETNLPKTYFFSDIAMANPSILEQIPQNKYLQIYEGF